jgi:Ca2+-binding RTX toxin-like protein
VGGEGRDVINGFTGSDRMLGGGGGGDFFIDGPLDEASKDDVLSGGDGDDIFLGHHVPAVKDITPDNPQGFFKGILHEMAHAAFWATHGAGFDYAERRAGIMARGSPAGIWPTEVDVSSVRAFTQGQNRVKQ